MGWPVQLCPIYLLKSWAQLHWPPHRVSSGGNASPCGTSSMPHRHQRHPHCKCQVYQDIGTSLQGQNHRRHPCDCHNGGTNHQVHICQHQRLIPPLRRGHGSPTAQGGFGHNSSREEVAEQYNAPLPTHHHEEIHLRIVYLYAPTRQFRAHPAHACQFLGPHGPNWPADAQSKGVS